MENTEFRVQFSVQKIKHDIQKMDREIFLKNQDRNYLMKLFKVLNLIYQPQATTFSHTTHN